MTNTKIKFPVLLIRENDKFLYGIKTDLGIISKGGETFYKKKRIEIYDSEGNHFELKKAELNGKANWKISLKYFQQMYEMKLLFEKKSKIELNQLKGEIINHMKKYKKHWLNIGTLDGLTKMVNNENSYSELIKKLK
mgnify:CR=1 FL=1|jgi:hypothetical protein